MDVPFTVEQFLDVFGRYNRAVWPMQVGFYAVAALLIALAVRPSPRGDRWIGGLLASLWAWMGIVYHWGFFRPINPAATLFAGLFTLQAVLFGLAGVRSRLSFRMRMDGYGIAGAIMIGYALVLYPVLGTLAGHVFPRSPTFGLPCPTAIFTFGLLLWADRRVPGWLIAIPAAWSLLGFSAAAQLSITEDYGLLAAGVIGTILILFRNHRSRPCSPAG
jgi:hypothetical protein